MSTVDPKQSADQAPPAASVDSPLWMVSQAPGLTARVVTLQNHRRAVDAGAGAGGARLSFSRAEVGRARAEFSDMIRRGERDLHQLASLLAEHFLGTVQRRSVVIGEIERTHERFTLTYGEAVLVKKGKHLGDAAAKEALAHLAEREIRLTVDLGLGRGKASAYGCDLTAGYVHENSTPL